MCNPAQPGRLVLLTPLFELDSYCCMAYEDLFDEPVALSSQARRIIDKFGGVPALTQALNAVGYRISRYSIYKWCYRKKSSGHGGTGGVIPRHSVAWVKKAARSRGIQLWPEDWKE